MSKKASSDLILTDIQKVAQSLGKTPWSYEYENLGQYTLVTVCKYLGSWKSACIAAGIPPTRGRGGQNRLENSVYLTRLSVLADDLGYKPNTRIYKMAYGVPIQIYRRWGSFENALKAAGLDSLPQPPRISQPHKNRKPSQYRLPSRSPTEQELLDDLRRVAKELDHTPTCEEYKAAGRFAFQTFFARIGSWTKACRLVGLVPHTTHEGGLYPVPAYDYERQWDKKVIRLTGSYELRFAKYLDEQGYKWLAHNEFPALPYTLNGKEHRYMPDFYVPSLEIYYETKGWFRKRDQEKVSLVRQQLKVNLVVVTREVLALFDC